MPQHLFLGPASELPGPAPELPGPAPELMGPTPDQPVGGGFEACPSMLRHTEICSLLPLAFSLLGHIVMHDHLNMRNETLRHLAIMYVNNMDKKRKCEEEE